MTQNGMKRWALIVICLLLLCPAANSGAAEGALSGNTHPLSAIPVLREMIEENNRADEEMARMGFYALRTMLFMKFVEPAEPYAPIDAGRMPFSGNAVDLTLAVRIEEAESDGSSDFTATALLTVNGRMVDFELNGSKSTGGILTFPLRSNQDYLLPVHAEQLPVSQGENEIQLTVMSCCPTQELYLDAQYLDGTFHAEQATEGAGIDPCPEERIGRVVTVRDQQAAPELMTRPLVNAGEQLAFESDHRGHTLIRTRPSPTLHFYLDNTADADLNGQRTGLMALFVDGQLQPVWDGQFIAEIRLQASDRMKAILLKTDYPSGERHSVCWYYAETESADEWKVFDRICFTLETR